MDDGRLSRFQAKVWRELRTGCWIWTASRDKHGYGRFVGTLAHCLAYQHYIGPVPAGLELDHLCRNRGCVNPWHLEPVTHLTNLQRGESWSFQRSKTHCPVGHLYDEENTLISGGARYCRTCKRLAHYKARRVA